MLDAIAAHRCIAPGPRWQTSPQFLHAAVWKKPPHTTPQASVLQQAMMEKLVTDSHAHHRLALADAKHGCTGMPNPFPVNSATTPKNKSNKSLSNPEQIPSPDPTKQHHGSKQFVHSRL
jgi:hypothetical protein